MMGMHRSERSSVASVKSVGKVAGRARKISSFGRSGRLLTGALIAAGLVTYGATVPMSGAGASTKTVRIVLGGGTDFTDASLYYAINLLKKEGITVDLNNLADPASALDAVISGQSDIYLGDPMEAAVAVGNGGAKIQYVGTVEQTTDYVILSLPNYTLKNLSGATLATAGAGTAGQIIADTALGKIGISPASLNDVTVGGTSARVTAILAGEVDLAPVLAPSAVPAVATGKVKILLNAGQVLGQYLQEGMIASDSFIHTSPALVQEVVTAFINSSRWASSKSHESQFLSVANANQLGGGLTTAEERSSWAALDSAGFFATNGAVCATAITKTEQYTYAAGGSLTKATTPSYKSWVDPKFVDAYLKANKDKPTAC
jgi:ABC-type nitrate/sulfonate/bicarbonate transport system substrate-binding protein